MHSSHLTLGNFYRLSCETTDGLMLGGTGLGQPRNPANKVGEQAADELIESCSRKVCLDQYAQDQVIVYSNLVVNVPEIFI